MTTHYAGLYDNPADITKAKEGWWVSLPVQIEVKRENGEIFFVNLLTSKHFSKKVIAFMV